ncbi:MAG: S-layer homology domain-containing protein [Oscillospiraceae bacterium]|nr:S-layer homology domain-containing protein [Oscillospiraceae bacterium]
MKKIRIAILALVAFAMLSVFPVECLAVSIDFPDIQGHWAERYISLLVEQGGISGMEDGKFHPNDLVTLRQFIKIIICSEYGEIDPINGGDWASGYMQKALEVGIIDAWDIEYIITFTRYDAARIVAGCLTYVFGEEAAADTSIVESFEDYPTSCRTCRSSFYETVGQCYVKGIITGRPGPVFDGDAVLTRAEACIMIMKMIDPALREPIID